MAKRGFEEVWNRIVVLAGERFATISGEPFTYSIKGNVFYPSRTDYQIAKRNFEQAYEMVPIDGPGAISRLLRGPSYVWAVLHDPRVSLGEW